MQILSVIAHFHNFARTDMEYGAQCLFEVYLGGIGSLESVPGILYCLKNTGSVGPVRQIGLSYRPARLHSLAELIPGLLNCLQILTQSRYF
jgi:hypothetical protein